MQIKEKATLIMLGTVVVLSSLSGYVNYRSNVKLIQTAMRTDLHTVSSMIQANIEASASKAASLASMVVNETDVQTAIRARNREQLIKIITPRLQIQKEKFGEVDANFHLPNAIDFLRVYKPTVYGDDLSKTRQLVLSAQKQQRPLQGIEISTTGVSIKGIDVVKDDKGFIATFEVGESFEAVLENIKQVTGFEAAAFVNNDMMNRIATSAPAPDKERVIGGYRNIFATNWSKIRAVVTPSLLNKVTDVLYRTEMIHGQFDGLVVMPLLDFTGTQIGSIWAVGNFSKYHNELRANLVLGIAYAALQALLLAAVVLIVFTASYFLPFRNIAERFRELAEGKAPDEKKAEEEIARWKDRPDEVGSLARSVEKLEALRSRPSKKEE